MYMVYRDCPPFCIQAALDFDVYGNGLPRAIRFFCTDTLLVK